jgi:nucleoside-diphosphate-sugar epimerase
VATAIVAAVLGAGPSGAYNLPGQGTVTLGDYARGVGAQPVPVPHAVVGLSSRLLAVAPSTPAWVAWLHTLRAPMLMDTTKAQELLGWTPKHTAAEALAATVATYLAGSTPAAR